MSAATQVEEDDMKRDRCTAPALGMHRLEPLVGDEGAGERVDMRLEQRLAVKKVASHIAMLLVGIMQKLPHLGHDAVREPFFRSWNRSGHDGFGGCTGRTATERRA